MADILAVPDRSKVEVSYTLTDGCKLEVKYTSSSGETTVIDAIGAGQSGAASPFVVVSGDKCVLRIHATITPSNAVVKVVIHAEGAGRKELQWRTDVGQVNREFKYELGFTVS